MRMFTTYANAHDTMLEAALRPVDLRVAPGAETAATLVLDPARPRQRIDGFGASITQATSYLWHNAMRHPHRALRKGANTVYIKAADHIEDLLTFMGAGGAAMRIMDQRLYNEMRNKTNRLSNCETANLGKSVQAAVQVQLAIERLQEAGALNTLPETLRQTAKVRMQYPDLPLAKLAQKFDPPVSKAGLSHRLKRIQEAAHRLPENQPQEKEMSNA